MCRDINLFVQSQTASQGMDEFVFSQISLVTSLLFTWASTPFLRPMPLLGLLPTSQLSAPAWGPAVVLQSPLRSRVLLSFDQASSDPSLVTWAQPRMDRIPWSPRPGWNSQRKHWMGAFGGEEWGEKHAPWLPRGKMVISKDRIKVVKEVRFVNYETQSHSSVNSTRVKILQSLQWDWKLKPTKKIQMSEDCLPGF